MGGAALAASPLKIVMARFIRAIRVFNMAQREDVDAPYSPGA
jgi:hypothetical protein